jgi:ISXO2-like transposase domain
VEVDETLIGGKARNMHKDRKAEVQKEGRNTGGKTTVIGALERDGQVRATVSSDRTAPVMRRHIRANVREGAHLMSDEAGYNWRMPREYQHDIVNHAERFG